MTRILLRAPKDPFEVVSPEETLARNLVASNSGNLVFLEAAWKLLATRNATLEVDRLRVRPDEADAINERYDAYVIPLANAFRPSHEATLLRMAELIERLRIPVVILGVGAQLSLSGDPARLRPMEATVRRFVEAVLARSGCIGVRGEMTAAYLAARGYRDVEVIGCPSMFLYGDTVRVTKQSPGLAPSSRVAINVSPYVKAMGDIVEHHVRRYPALIYVAQDLPTLQLLLWGDAGSASPGAKVPTHPSHPLFRDDKVRYYVDPWPWIRDLRAVEFSFGTRIHGNIAATLAGTPAFVFAHDSRTLELARYFGLPHLRMPDVPPDVDAADLYERADYTALHAGQRERFERFRAYLQRYGLRDVFATGEDAAFDRRVAHTPYPPAVRASSAAVAGRPLAALVHRARYRIHRAVWSRRVRAIRRVIVQRTNAPFAGNG